MPDIIETFESMSGFINLVIILGVAPVIKMSHTITAISTKLDYWEETLKNCKGSGKC